MIVKLTHLPDSGVDLKFEEKASAFDVLSELENNGEYIFRSPIRTNIFLEPVRDIYRAKGRLRFTVQQQCSKCLDEFETVINEIFSVAYIRKPEDINFDSDAEIELTTQEMGMLHFQGDEINFQEMIQEQALLALPMHPRCADDCKGLCPKCGLNLNHEQCRCDKEPVDERFAVLKSFKLE